MPTRIHPDSNGAKPTLNLSPYPGKSITETIVNGFFTLDRKWTVRYWNKAAEKLLGIPAKDIVGKNLWEKFAGLVPVEFHTAYSKVFLPDTLVHSEEYWGEMGAWFDVIIYHSNDTLSVSFKTSKRSLKPENLKKPVQQMQVINELYRFVTEVTNDCLWEWDLAAGQLFWIDGGHKRVFGYPVENALIPQSFWENCLHPDDRSRVLNGLNKLITERTSATWEEEYRFKRSDGEYTYVYDRGHILYDDEKGSIRMIGATQDISARKSIELRLLDSERKLLQERLHRQKEITAAVLKAQENERAAIGKELHDNLNQVLGAAKLYIEIARADEQNSEVYLEKASVYIVSVIEQIRKISKTLANPGTMIMGLSESINILLDDVRVIHPLKIEFLDDGMDDSELEDRLQLDIFRIVQEQLNNILKHSGATHATIHLAKNKKEVVVDIFDNGKGNDLSQPNKGVGILNIISRAELCHGKVIIASKPGQGYELKVTLPLTVPTAAHARPNV